MAEGETTERQVITAEKVPDYLGPQKHISEVAERTNESGVATGLAWTAVGGEILFIEATRMPGTGKLQLTGQLGDVMKESAHAALSYVRSHTAELGVDPAAMAKRVRFTPMMGSIPWMGKGENVSFTLMPFDTSLRAPSFSCSGSS